MTEQEMAEWLAEKVLGIEVVRDTPRMQFKTRLNLKGKCPTPVEFIYSPDGFFAVWDAVEMMEYFVGMEMYIPPDKELQGEAYSCTIRKVTDESYIGCGKDRYEAFYNAVYEAMKE